MGSLLPLASQVQASLPLVLGLGLSQAGHYSLYPGMWVESRVESFFFSLKNAKYSFLKIPFPVPDAGLEGTMWGWQWQKEVFVSGAQNLGRAKGPKQCRGTEMAGHTL